MQSALRRADERGGRNIEVSGIPSVLSAFSHDTKWLGLSVRRERAGEQASGFRLGPQSGGLPSPPLTSRSRAEIMRDSPLT